MIIYKYNCLYIHRHICIIRIKLNYKNRCNNVIYKLYT